jgi:hypothetical protein
MSSPAITNPVTDSSKKRKKKSQIMPMPTTMLAVVPEKTFL